MMARYINRRGESIEVSDSHVETAIELKLELQKESASGRTSWARHKRMMAEEGFEDSDSNESYRQMVKQEQKKRDLLPEAPKYADMVSDKKLESVRSALGEMYIAKRSTQNANRELNKVKREMADRILLFEDLKEHISEIDFSSLKGEKLPKLPKTDNEMLVTASDWHVGLLTEDYNYESTLEKVEQYAQEVIHYANTFGINTVHVAGIGDLLEGAYLRSTQAFEIEFTFSEQVSKATEALFKLINLLATELNVVYIGSLAGNHSRMFTKNFTLENNSDSAENIIDEQIKSFISMLDNPRITVEDHKQSNTEIAININGRKVKAVHGDLLPKNGDKITKLISSDNIEYDVLVFGHYHNANIAERNHDKLEIGTGSLYGTDGFSKMLGHETIASQTVIVFEGSRVLPIRIPLD